MPRCALRRPAPWLPALALTLGVSLTLGAAVPVVAAEREQLVIGTNQFPSTFHPNIDPLAAKTYILGMAHRPFTTYDAKWQLTCLLCTALPTPEAGTVVVEPRPNGKTGLAVTYTIRADARWGDGTPVTTRDVVFTWTAGRHPLSGFVNAELFTKNIVDITVKDERTFTLHLDKRSCDYQAINDFELVPAHLEQPIFEAAPAEYDKRTRYQTDTTNPGLWNGPYRLSEVAPGAHVVLEPNAAWAGPPPPFKRVVVKIIENSAALEANLLSGEVDYLPGEVGLPLDQALALEKRVGQRFQVVVKPGLSYEHLDLNLDNPIVADLRVRQALLLAIDREQISRQLFGGRQPVAHNMVNPLDRAFDPNFVHYPYDPARAAALLDQAGWSGRDGAIRTNAKGERLSLVLQTTAGNRTRELIEQVLQAQWRAAGIEIRIDNQPARVLFGQTLRERRFTGLALFAWLSAPDNIPRTTLHSSMIPAADNGYAGQNLTGFRHAEVDQVLDDLETTCEPQPRQALWTRLQQLYAEQLPALPLFFRADAYIMPKGLSGIVPTGHQYPTTFWIESWHWQP